MRLERRRGRRGGCWAREGRGGAMGRMRVFVCVFVGRRESEKERERENERERERQYERVETKERE